MKEIKIKIFKIKERSNCDFGDVIISDETGDGADCEHCGNLPPFSAAISNGGTYYCVENCADGCFDEDEDGVLSEKDRERISKECEKREDAYILKRYNQIKKKKGKSK